MFFVYVKIALKNEGIFDCELNLIMDDENEVFKLIPSSKSIRAYPNLQPHCEGFLLFD